MTMQNALVIKAKGGLGNRMLSGVTGLVLARLQGRAPFIDWRDGMYVPAGENLYPLLFNANWMGDISALDNASDVAPSIWSGRLQQHPTDLIHAEFPDAHQHPLIYRKLSVDLAGTAPQNSVAVFWSYVSKLKRLKRQMARHPDFGGKALDAVTRAMLDRYFDPVSEVKELVDAALPRDDRPAIGVHIRFTDRKAPLGKIMGRLARLRDSEPGARLFLATDSITAQEAVLARFPDAVQIDKSLDAAGAALHVASGQFADPVAEARNALADMVALSRCDWLVHSSHSTFSVTAALMGDIPESRQIDVDRFNPKVRLKQFVQARI